MFDEIDISFAYRSLVKASIGMQRYELVYIGAETVEKHRTLLAKWCDCGTDTCKS